VLNNKLFITIDIDWAPDYMIEYVIGLLQKYDCKATFFWTHESDLLKKVLKNDLFEVALHPNFNNCFNHNNVESTVKKLKDLIPSAVSVRSHSLLTGTPIQNLYTQYGLKVDSSFYIPSDNCFYWKSCKGLIFYPFSWSDYIDVLCSQAPRDLFKSSVIAFHPIHIYLNIKTLEQYEAYKCNKEVKVPSFEVACKKGVRDIFENLLYVSNLQKRKTYLIKDILEF